MIFNKEIEEAERQINIHNNLISHRESDIEDNAKGKYNACLHADLIENIQLSKNWIKVYQGKIESLKDCNQKVEEFVDKLKEKLRLGIATSEHIHICEEFIIDNLIKQFQESIGVENEL